MKKKTAGLKIWQLMVLLFGVVFGSLLFVGLAAGWFTNPQAKLDKEYFCGEDCSREFIDIEASDYDELVAKKKSFVVFVDQGGCYTADRLREFVLDWAGEAGVRVYRIMFSEMKETKLYEVVKYYPSVAVVSKGRPLVWLRADSDEDAELYNNSEKFKEWILRFLQL